MKVINWSGRNAMTRIRFSFARREALKHISHLDMMRLFQRALRRSGLPLAYSEGYSPHLKFNLAVPLPVNVTASEEFGEIFLSGTVSPDHFITALEAQLPEGLDLTGAFLEDCNAPSLPSLIGAALYRAILVAEEGCRIGWRQYREALERLLSREEILLKKTKKKKKDTYVNIRPYIFEAYFSEPESLSPLTLHMLLQAGSSGGVSPFFILKELEKELPHECNYKAHWELHRERLYRKQDQFLQPLSERM